MIVDLGALNWTEWAAIIGAATGIVALTIQFFQYIHLKPKLRIDITPECFILKDEFKTQHKDKPNEGSYRPATYVVISNVGQMTATILRFEVQARNYLFRFKPFRKLYRFSKITPIVMSNSEGIIVDQSRKIPTIIEAGHSWLAIIDAQSFRNQLDQFPYVYLELKVSHKKNLIRRKIKLKS